LQIKPKNLRSRSKSGSEVIKNRYADPEPKI